jgi:hypothetical protein
MNHADQLDPAAVRAQLQRILGSSGFDDSPALQSFLQYVVAETFTGRAGQLKGYTITVRELLDLQPDFAHRGLDVMPRWVFSAKNAHLLFGGLAKTGLARVQE